MRELFEVPIFSVLVTLGAYWIGVALQKKVKSPLCNPLLVAVILIVVFQFATGMDLKTYQAGNSYISWLLTPATVSLAVPMYEQFRILRKHAAVLLAGVAAGAISCLCMVLTFSLMMRFAPEMTISLLPKSVTTAIGVAISEELGGIAAICTFAIVLTGTLGNVAGVWLSKILRLRDPISQGVAFGTASHVIGTSKAQEVSQLAGAVSSLSLTVAGLLTAAFVSVLSQFIV